MITTNKLRAAVFKVHVKYVLLLVSCTTIAGNQTLFSEDLQIWSKLSNNTIGEVF